MGKGKWFMTLFTVILVAAGAFMPFGVSYLQDNQMESKKDYRELSGVHLTLREKDMTTVQSLGLLSNGYTRIKWEGITQLTEQKAQEAAKEAVFLMTQEGLFTQEAIEESDAIIQAFLVVSSSESSDSGVFWECTWTGADENFYIVTVNDTEGKMVQFRIIQNSSSTVAIAGNASAVGEEDSQYENIEMVWKWAYFLGEYYGFESEQIKVGVEEGGNMIMFIALPAGTGREELEMATLKIPFDINVNGIKFNR